MDSRYQRVQHRENKKLRTELKAMFRESASWQTTKLNFELRAKLKDDEVAQLKNTNWDLTQTQAAFRIRELEAELETMKKANGALESEVARLRAEATATCEEVPSLETCPECSAQCLLGKIVYCAEGCGPAHCPYCEPHSPLSLESRNGHIYYFCNLCNN